MNSMKEGTTRSLRYYVAILRMKAQHTVTFNREAIEIGLNSTKDDSFWSITTSTPHENHDVSIALLTFLYPTPNLLTVRVDISAAVNITYSLCCRSRALSVT
jgi:hypothetical protein